MSASSNDQHANKNLPLKKRRTYLTDSPMIIADENENDAQQRVVSKSCTGHEVRAPTPPASPRLELTGQRCTHLLANSTNARPSPCDSFSVEHLLAHHRGSAVQHKSGYATPEDATIEEHFRKSLGNHYEKFTDRCFTPDDSSSNSSSTEQTSVDSIEEHFARSLAKFLPAHPDQLASVHRPTTESIVDDHFAKALGSATWEKLKERH